jgi:hypothetical protein
MGSNARLEKIIGYVQLNQGCLTEEAFEGVKNDMSRGTFFKYLKELVKSKMIRVEQPNKRDRKLYPYNDLLKSVPEELNKFEVDLKNFLDKEQKHIETLKNSRNSKANELKEIRTTMLLRCASLFLFDIVAIYNYKALFKWTTRIREPEVVNNLYLIVFTKTNDIRNLILDKYKELLPSRTHDIQDFVNRWIMRDETHIDKLRKRILVYRMNTRFSKMDPKNELVIMENYLKELTKYMGEE